MPMETLEIGPGPDRSRLARIWDALSPGARRYLVLVLAIGFTIGAAVTLAHTDVRDTAQGPPSPYRGPTGDALGPPPWAMQPRQMREPAFQLVNRTGQRVFVSTPPRFVFTVPPHRRLLFARAPVCTYQRFTARFRHGPALGTIHDFCSASRWVVLPSGKVRLLR
jgi:hypothetical protein